MTQELKLFKVRDVAEHLSVGEREIWRWVDKGLLPVVQPVPRGAVRVRSDDLDRFLRSARRT